MSGSSFPWAERDLHEAWEKRPKAPSFSSLPHTHTHTFFVFLRPAAHSGPSGEPQTGAAKPDLGRLQWRNLGVTQDQAPSDVLLSNRCPGTWVTHHPRGSPAIQSFI